MLVKLCLFPSFHKVTSSILKHLWFNDENAFDFCLKIFHTRKILCKGTLNFSFQPHFNHLLFVYFTKLP